MGNKRDRIKDQESTASTSMKGSATEEPRITVYSLDNCPNCELLKRYLHERGILFAEQDMATPASLTDLRVNGVFVREAPVLRKDATFLTTEELFSAGKVKEDVVNRLVAGE
jgi:glutaredoxin